MNTWLLRWLVYWGHCVEGVIGVITFGSVMMGLPLYFAKKLARARAKQGYRY